MADKEAKDNEVRKKSLKIADKEPKENVVRKKSLKMADKEPKENEVRSLPQRNALFTSSLRQWRLCIRLCSVAFNYSRDYQNCTHLPYSSTQTSREKYTLLQHPRFPM